LSSPVYGPVTIAVWDLAEVCQQQAQKGWKDGVIAAEDCLDGDEGATEASTAWEPAAVFISFKMAAAASTTAASMICRGC
jgi:hypothetical protein